MTTKSEQLVEEIKSLQQRVDVHGSSRKALMIALRKALMELSDLWIVHNPNSRGWREFCRQEFGSSCMKTYSSALTYACFERYCFDLPVGTLPSAFFFQSRVHKEVAIRYSAGRGWKLDKDAVDKARSFWEKACEIAKGDLPTGQEMKQAIALCKGEEFVFKTRATKLKEKVDALEAENDRLKQQLQEAAMSENSGIQLEYFRERLTDYSIMIKRICLNYMQEARAYEILINQGSRACRKYLNELQVARANRRLA